MTGDKALRAAASSSGVPVCGTIWVLDELHRKEALTDTQTLEYFREIKKQNGGKIRLPAAEIDKRIASLEANISMKRD